MIPPHLNFVATLSSSFFIAPEAAQDKTYTDNTVKSSPTHAHTHTAAYTNM